MTTYLTNVIFISAAVGLIMLVTAETKTAKSVRCALSLCLIAVCITPLVNTEITLPEIPRIEENTSDIGYDGVIREAGKNMCRSLEEAIKTLFGTEAEVEMDFDTHDVSNIIIKEVRVSVPTGNKEKIAKEVAELIKCENVTVSYRGEFYENK